jgi:DNA repair exonuclease SbcCD ATPase subunit
MILTELHTRNFKKLGDRDFTFSTGLNFILGKNGAGKSTLTRAIGAALFGVSALPGVADDVATWGKATWSVSLHFDIAGSGYVVTRSKSSASLYRDKELIASGNTPVTKEIESLLGLDVKDYHLFVHSRQGETSYVLRYGATALQRKVEEFSGVDVIDKVQGLARSKQKVEVMGADSASAKLLDGEYMRQVMEDLEAAVSRLDQPVEMMPELPSVEVTVVRNGHRRYLNYLAEVNNYDTSKDLLTEQLEGIVVPPQPQPVNSLQEALKEAKSHQAAYEGYHSTKKLLTSKLADLTEPELPEPKEFPEGIEEQQAALGQEVAELRVSVCNLKKAVSEGVCNACGTILAGNLERHKTELQDAQDKLSASESKLDEVARIGRAQAVYRQKVTAYVTALNAYNSTRAKLEEQMSELTEPADYSDKIFDLRKQLDEVEKLQEAYESAVRRSNEVKRKLNSLAAPQEVAEVTEQQVVAAEKEWESYHVAKSVAERDRAERVAAQSKLDAAEREIERQEGLTLEVQDRTKLAELYSQLAVFLADRRDRYLKEVWSNILVRASEQLNHVTSGWLTGVKLLDGKFLFEEEGAWIPVIEASGAQSAFIGTALRLSMNRVLYGSDSYLIFDEPTADMTEENSRALVAGIAGAAKQVFVVTHRESDQGLADNVVEV